MIQVTVFTKKCAGTVSDYEYSGVRLSGHAGFDDSGRDIICAAVSTLVFNTVNSIEVFTAVSYTHLDVYKRQALMVGRNNIFKIDKTPAKPRETVLKVKDLKYGYAYEKMVLNGISFSVRRGEILGIAGVEGNGQRELIEVITRLRENESGTITFLENDVGNASVKEFRNLGCGYIPVSYTHLDVYKRQVISELLHNNRNGWFSARSDDAQKPDNLPVTAYGPVSYTHLHCRCPDVY